MRSPAVQHTIDKHQTDAMKDDFGKLLRLRLDEGNRCLIQRFTEEKQRLNARGLLHSSETVKAMHGVAKKEIAASAETVVVTAIDVLRKKNILPSNKKLQNLCSAAFLKRKEEIEAIYLSEARDITRGLQNHSLLDPLMSFQDFYGLQCEEMVVSLRAAYDKYRRDRGGNFAAILRNRFLDHPVVAWAAIVVTVIVLVATFTGAIGALRAMFGQIG